MKKIIELFHRWRRGETIEGQFAIPLPLLILALLILAYVVVKLIA